MLRLAADISNK